MHGSGRFDGAQVRIGIVDWESGETLTLYHGSIGAVLEQDGTFSAELVSRKAELLRDPVPRTSPTCRAEFCAPGCNLPPQYFTFEGTLDLVDVETNSVVISTNAILENLVGGRLRWLDGPQAGLATTITGILEGALTLDSPVDPSAGTGASVMVREGCDHTLTTCSVRFNNAINFRGEPHLPGNDLLTRYPVPGQ
ncbi:MAG: phage BR0599 family protein [Novosphingobium sp.]|nr:phage BR0599 family protein [Novosphingobium sp.]